jgi:hypothetical protein
MPNKKGYPIRRLLLSFASLSPTYPCPLSAALRQVLTTTDYEDKFSWVSFVFLCG